MGRRWYSTLLGGLAVFFASTVSAAPAYFTYEGYLTDLQNVPIASATESFRFEIFAENGANRCLVYSEDHPAVTVSEGSFIVQVGKGANPVFHQGLASFREIANPSVLAGAGGCNFSLGHSGTRRLLQITLTSGGASVALGALVMSSSVTAMYALDASYLSGKAATDFVLDSAIPVCAANQALQRTGANYSCVNVLSSLPADVMLKADNLSGLANPATARTSLGLGAAAVKNVGTATGDLVEVDGGGKIPVALLPNGLVTSATAAGGDLQGTYPNPTLATLHAGGQFYRVQVDAKGRVTAGNVALGAADIPDLDWSKIITGKPTTLGGYGITDALPVAGGTVTGALVVNGNLRTAGKFQLGAFTGADPALSAGVDGGALWFRGDTGTLRFYDGTTARTVLLQNEPMMKSFNGQTGAAQFLATSIDGLVSSPEWSSVGNIHTLRLPRADSIGVNEGLISKAQFDAFNDKQTSNLGTGMVWVGNGANKAEARSISGDISLSMTGTATLTSLQGQGFDLAGLQADQFLGYNGAQWANRSIRPSMLKDSVGASPAVPICGEATALVYDSVNDKFVCAATRSVARAARTVYVRHGGDDSLCRGTANVDVVAGGACAFRTIQGALNSLPLEIDASVSIDIQPGIYSVTSMIGVHVRQMGHYGSGTFLTLQPSAAGTITLMGNDSNDQIGILISPQSRNVYLRGFNLIGFGGNQATAVAVDGGAGIFEGLSIGGSSEGLAVAAGGTAQLLGSVTITVDEANARGVRVGQARLGYEELVGGDRFSVIASGSQARGIDLSSGGDFDLDGLLDIEVINSTASGLSVGAGAYASLRGGARIDLNNLNTNYPTGINVYGGQLESSGTDMIEFLGVARGTALSIEKGGSFESWAPLNITTTADASAIRLSGSSTAALRANSGFYFPGPSGPPVIDVSGSSRLTLGEFSGSRAYQFVGASASSRVAIMVRESAQVDLVAGATRTLELSGSNIGALVEVNDDGLLNASMIDPGATLNLPGIKLLRSAPTARLRPLRSEFTQTVACPTGMVGIETGVCVDMASRLSTTSYGLAVRACQSAGLRLCEPADMHLACSVGTLGASADGSWLSVGGHPGGGGSSVSLLTNCDGAQTYTFQSITALGPSSKVYCCSK